MAPVSQTQTRPELRLNYSSNSLEAVRRWSYGGQLLNRVYGRLSNVDYECLLSELAAEGGS